MPDRPNIIYIVCHDLGRSLGCYGNGFTSPQLDRFAQEGVLLANANCASNACSPSRGCVWTGQYAHTNGLMGLVNRGWTLPAERLTIVDHLKAAGYHTAISGLDHIRRNRADLRVDEDLEQTARTAASVDAAIGFLKKRQDNDQPFYLNVGLREVHPSQWATYHAGGLRETENPLIDHYGRAFPDEAPLPPTYADHPACRREVANFNACIAYMDFHLGRLFNAIDRLGYRDNTLVMFTTDHGIEGMRGKSFLYQPGTEIACLMRGPGITPDTRFDPLVSNIDFTPTFLEAAGADIPDAIQGKSFWPALTGKPYEPHEAIFAERNYHGPAQGTWDDGLPDNFIPSRSIQTDRWLLIRVYSEAIHAQWTPETIPELTDPFP
ncbi:MAG: sulfatase family protein, partial [Opitutales bacterium]